MNVLRAAALALSLVTLPALASPPARPQAGAGATSGASKAADAKHAESKPAEACHHPADAKADAKAGAPAQESGWVLTRGEPLKGAPGVTVAELVRAPEAHKGHVVRVEGTVRKACERKGCWLELADGKDGAGVRVTFKDYGFFVPTDSAGARARVEGVVEVTELTEGAASHYASEGGTVPRGADGKPREVQLVASGVELRR